MYGLTEDLLYNVGRHIWQNWEARGHDVEYFVDVVRKSGLSAAEVADFLFEHKAVAPVCVVTVFSAFVDREMGRDDGTVR